MLKQRKTFDELVNFFSAHTKFPIVIDHIRAWIVEREFQHEIQFHEVDMDPDISKGQCFQFVENSGKKVAFISVSNKLTYCWKRFVLTKEMTHLVDDPKTYTSSIVEIENLTRELSAQAPLSAKMSDAYYAERVAEYKALALLAPEDAVSKIRPKFRRGQLSEIEVATFFRIPSLWVPVLMSDSYAKIYEAVLKDP